MNGKLTKIIVIFMVIINSILFNDLVMVLAEESNTINLTKYYIGSVKATNKGYSNVKNIDLKDKHFGWELGHFFINGYTSVINGESENPVFLKTAGDTVALWFNLEQDIDNLNGNNSLVISEDINGYDEYFGVEKQNFSHGTLIIRHTDYQNLTKNSIVYTNYLSSHTITGVDTKVELFEEGDYEVALDYEIKYAPRKIWDLEIIPEYYHYQIYFKFSVRNGNCMVYPFDTITKAELSNNSITENGFYLDFAKSYYLEVNIKKEVLNESADGLIEDIRFNKPAKEGDNYTDEGLYTIIVNNKYTGQQTEKKIYVGTNNILKAYATTGLSIEKIKEEVAQGGKINDNGTIIFASNKSITNSQTLTTNNRINKLQLGGIILIIFLLIVVLIFILKIRKRKIKISTDTQLERDDT